MKVIKAKKEAVKGKREVKENMFKVRLSNSDLQSLKTISRQLEVSDSETIRLLIHNKIKQLKKQINIFE